MDIPQARTQAGRRPRRGEGRRVSTRAFTALLVLFASLLGVAQRAAALGCAGSATTGVASRSAAASRDVVSRTTGHTTDAVSEGVTDPAPPVGIPGEVPHGVAGCGGPVALPIAAGSHGEAAAVGLLPVGRATVFSGADAPKPLVGPPRVS